MYNYSLVILLSYICLKSISYVRSYSSNVIKEAVLYYCRARVSCTRTGCWRKTSQCEKYECASRPKLCKNATVTFISNLAHQNWAKGALRGTKWNTLHSLFQTNIHNMRQMSVKMHMTIFCLTLNFCATPIQGPPAVNVPYPKCFILPHSRPFGGKRIILHPSKG